MSRTSAGIRSQRNNNTSLPGIHSGVFMVALLLSMICFPARVPATAANADPIDIRASVSEVQLGMVATDVLGQPVADLAPTDINVSEDGLPIRQFGLSSAQNLPLLATVIYDTSESNQKSWRQMQKPVIRFLQSTISEDDQLWVAAFDSKLEFKMRIEQPAQLVQALNAPGGSQNITGFNDALLRTLQEQPAPERKPRRAAMIVLSDGEDNYSVHSLTEVISAAQRAKVAIYTIHRMGKRGWGDGDSAMHVLAQGTGGRDFTVANIRELERALATIASELRSAYVLYYPARPSRMGGEFRSVTVRPNRGKRVRIQVQNGYYIPADAGVIRP